MKSKAVYQSQAYTMASDLLSQVHDDALDVRGAMGLMTIGAQVAYVCGLLNARELLSILKRALEDEQKARGLGKWRQ